MCLSINCHWCLLHLLNGWADLPWMSEMISRQRLYFKTTTNTIVSYYFSRFSQVHETEPSISSQVQNQINSITALQIFYLMFNQWWHQSAGAKKATLFLSRAWLWIKKNYEVRLLIMVSALYSLQCCATDGWMTGRTYDL